MQRYWLTINCRFIPIDCFCKCTLPEVAMISLIMLFLLGIVPALAADGIEPISSCDTASQFNDPKFQPVLDRLKGTVSMSGKFVCSAALVTFKDRSSSTQGLVLTAGHCSDRGSIQIPLRDK